jgi:hypothetical protein
MWPAPNIEGSCNIQDVVGIEVSEEWLGQVDIVNAWNRGEHLLTELYVFNLYEAPHIGKYTI